MGGQPAEPGQGDPGPELTGLVHGEDEAKKAEAGAKAFFAGGGDSENMPTTELEEEDFQEDAIDLISCW